MLWQERVDIPKDDAMIADVRNDGRLGVTLTEVSCLPSWKYAAHEPISVKINLFTRTRM